jgi:hypothetical protein
MESGLSNERGVTPMRRAFKCLAVLSVAVVALPGVATALPSVKVKGSAVPIPGFPHTGNILGAGAAVRAQVSISGTEYGGFPPPLIGITAFLPVGVHLHPQGFPTCPLKTIVEEREPQRCPKGSAAGPVGKAYGVVAFGKERVHETAEISSFFAPGGGLEFFTEGHSPVSLEIPTTAHVTHLNGGGGFGPELIAQVPLVETVPGAPDASVEAIDITLGAAYRKNGKTVYYGRVPKSCPKGGFRVRSDLTFAENGNESKPETVTVNFRAPCPKR